MCKEYLSNGILLDYYGGILFNYYLHSCPSSDYNFTSKSPAKLRISEESAKGKTKFFILARSSGGLGSAASPLVRRASAKSKFLDKPSGRAESSRSREAMKRFSFFLASLFAYS